MMSLLGTNIWFTFLPLLYFCFQKSRNPHKMGIYFSNDFIVGTFSDAIPKPLIFLSNSLLCFFQPDKKPCLPLKLITFRISSCIIWCIWCKSRLREWVLQSDYLLNYNLYYWISQSDQKSSVPIFILKYATFSYAIELLKYLSSPSNSVLFSSFVTSV